jgi:DNA invertase Pin-like site-specific DNA recombinase
VKRKTEIQNTIEPMDFVAYYRVSTKKQGDSGLSLEVQEEAVKRYIAANHWRKLVAAFPEVDSGTRNSRPEVRKALAMCKQRGATLIVAKLDRLARDVHFITGLKKSGVPFVACDQPEASPLIIHILASVAEDEAVRIRTRIREALKAAEKRGTKLGGERILKKKNEWGKKGEVWNLGSVAHLALAARKQNAEDRDEPLKILAKSKQHDGLTLTEIGAELKRYGHHPPRGGQWHPAQVQRLVGVTRTRKKQPRKKRVS